MTAGTLPSRRRERAAPLPERLRGAASRAAWRAMSRAFPSIEQRTHRLIAVGIADRLREQTGDRENFELVELLVRRQPDRIGHRYLDDRRLAEPLDRGPGEYCMGRAEVDVGGAESFQRIRGLDHRP